MEIQQSRRVKTGIQGFDEIILGGLLRGRNYLIRGGPGCGKTTFGLHYLHQGVSEGEAVLFITMGESEAEIRRNTKSMPFDMDKIVFLDMTVDSNHFSQSESYDIFSPAEVERSPTTEKIMEKVESLKPSRIFIDSLSQFRYLTPDVFHFRKQTISFLRYLGQRGATVMFASEATKEVPDDDLQFLSDGIFNLSFNEHERGMQILKFRGSDFIYGNHALTLGPSGIEVYPRLEPKEADLKVSDEMISTGVPDLDELVQGGVERGTVTLITGPSGVGKSTLGMLFMKEAAGRGERSVVYTFEESQETLFRRCEGINIPVRKMVEKGILGIKKIEPLQYMPNEFAQLVRNDVVKLNTRIVMIDSFSGYRVSLRGQDLVSHVHALTKYLTNLGVTVFLINEMESITGEFRATEIGISYLADNIVFLRYIEIDGEMRKAIGVLKKRLSDFERNLREFQITRFGVKVGAPLKKLRGVLTGTPTWSESPPRFDS